MENTFSYEEIVKEANNGNINILLEKDQLNQVRIEERAFHELTEAAITFSPTFKHVIDSHLRQPEEKVEKKVPTIY